MERRKSTLTRENYARAIISLSRRYSSTSAFPGNNYVDIAEWLLQDRALLSPGKTEKESTDDIALFDSASEQGHDLVVAYTSGERKWNVQSYSQDQHASFFAANSTTRPGAGGEIVFVRGFISPSWLSAIGGKYNIDPEFFRRHMDFLSPSIHRHAYSLPSLASSSHNIFRLCISTILHRDDFGGQDLQRQRSDQATELATYKIQQLGSTKVHCGDSLVREYSTVCPSFSVLEQWISLYLAKTEKGWAIIAWMDQGRPLENSPPGPWTRHLESKATSLPILQHHDKMAFRTTKNRLDPDANESAEIQQSTTILPLQYDSLVALVDLGRRASQDPLHMCIPLFAHAAFSENQFLNMVESKIQVLMNNMTIRGVSTDALATLQYFSTILNRHAKQLKESHQAFCQLANRSDFLTVFNGGITGERSISERATSPGPGGDALQRHSSDTETARMVGSSTHANGPFTVKGVMEDLDEMHVRCVNLSGMCHQGITLAMNMATVEESRKAVEQSKRVKKLTLLATLFIPLSFTSGLFGMNIDILGQSSVGLWWFFVLCVPIVLASYVFYLWDYQALKGVFARLIKVTSRQWRSGRGEKDPGHIA